MKYLIDGSIIYENDEEKKDYEAKLIRPNYCHVPTGNFYEALTEKRKREGFSDCGCIGKYCKCQYKELFSNCSCDMTSHKCNCQDKTNKCSCDMKNNKCNCQDKTNKCSCEMKCNCDMKNNTHPGPTVQHPVPNVQHHMPLKKEHFIPQHRHISPNYHHNNRHGFTHDYINTYYGFNDPYIYYPYVYYPFDYYPFDNVVYDNSLSIKDQINNLQNKIDDLTKKLS